MSSIDLDPNTLVESITEQLEKIELAVRKALLDYKSAEEAEKAPRAIVLANLTQARYYIWMTLKDLTS